MRLDVVGGFEVVGGIEGNPYPIGGMCCVDCRVFTIGTRPLSLSIKPAFRQGRSEVKNRSLTATVAQVKQKLFRPALADTCTDCEEG